MNAIMHYTRQVFSRVSKSDLGLHSEHQTGNGTTQSWHIISSSILRLGEFPSFGPHARSICQVCCPLVALISIDPMTPKPSGTRAPYSRAQSARSTCVWYFHIWAYPVYYDQERTIFVNLSEIVLFVSSWPTTGVFVHWIKFLHVQPERILNTVQWETHNLKCSLFSGLFHFFYVINVKAKS